MTIETPISNSTSSLKPPAYSLSYEPAFRGLLWRLRAARLQRGVDLLMQRAHALANQGADAPSAFDFVYRRARQHVIERLVRMRQLHGTESRSTSPESNSSDDLAVASQRSLERVRTLVEASIVRYPHSLTDGPSPDFHCDAGLGGLARWLRAAGYDARFFPGIRDDELVRKTLVNCAILLTTDGPLMERAAVHWGMVPALLVPLTTNRQGQFQFVSRTLDLARKPTRCMTCGGLLRSVDKEANRHRIPVRTFPWCNDYFECERCGQLFWRGSHWRRIETSLSQAK